VLERDANLIDLPKAEPRNVVRKYIGKESFE